MLHSQNIICISSIDWDFNWQGHQEIMATFAKNGNKVLYIENTGIRTPNLSDIPRIKKRIVNWFRSLSGIRQEGPNLFIYSPVILPFPYSRLASFVNRFIMLNVVRNWMKASKFSDPIIWTFLPTRISIDIIKRIENRLSVYYCIADFDELVKDTKKVKRTEKELLKAVDLVFAQGTSIKQRCLEFNRHVAIFPFGVKQEVFESFNNMPTKEMPKDLEPIKGKRIGYIGGIHKHVSYDLIEYLARERPDWSIILVGPDQINYFSKERPPNIKILGMKKHQELPAYINGMDVCLIPYQISNYTNTVYPTKLNEYLLIGKPVVSTALAEVKEFNKAYGNIIRIAESKEEFLSLVEGSLKDADGEEILKRQKAASENTWERRIEDMSGIIEERIAERASLMERSWKENLIRIYHASKRKFAVVTAVVLLAYFAVFYSPLLWFLASPLRIDQAPQEADAIVVFGGGVGEGGSPGKSTIERARFSADLYNRGFSKKIIFSSGYSYIHNDAEDMKRFAMSMGVRPNDMILDIEGDTCYKNVKYTTEILRKNNFDTVILVSSPYNMRRASLLYRRIAKDIRVYHAPVPNPQFYIRARRVRMEQIRAIMHEYLGILYYYIKGYIR